MTDASVPMPRGGVAVRMTIGVVAVAVLYVLLTHRSDHPLVFGYSLFYLLCLLFAAVAGVFVTALFRRFRSSAWYVLAAIGLPLFTLAALLELGAHIFAYRNPSYDVLYLQPDRQTGWKMVPNLRFTWAGPHWAALSFSAPTVANSAGFRDLERSLEPSPGVTRIAILGDSMIEAIQVPLDKAASQLLERSLNDGGADHRYEVLNFGVSAYGLGQYLLNWEAYVRAYHPTLVYAFVAKFHMMRTIDKGGMLTQGAIDLQTRPTFKLVNNELVREPAANYDKFASAQSRIIAEDLGGQRSKQKRLGFFMRIVLDEMNVQVSSVQARFDGEAAAVSPDIPEDVLAINMRILEELGKSVNETGARFVIVDAIRYFSAGASGVALSERVKALSAAHKFGYVDASDDMLAAEQQGPTAFAYDGHLNEVGNAALANAMSKWTKSQREQVLRNENQR